MESIGNADRTEKQNEADSAIKEVLSNKSDTTNDQD